ncbi:TPA: hypothetical protein ACIAM1_002357 [Salmonella enterica subsp. enterica serovar Chester]
MEITDINTINGIKKDLADGKRTVKAIAAECRIFKEQTSHEEAKAVYARLSDCTNRKQFEAVFASL